uniref:Uncharacterized protein n=1 Tax=Rhizophora mucronata TaxID=61149 RepID=A0A2P2QET9_RHIMU
MSYNGRETPYILYVSFSLFVIARRVRVLICLFLS